MIWVKINSFGGRHGYYAMQTAGAYPPAVTTFALAIGCNDLKDITAKDKV